MKYLLQLIGFQTKRQFSRSLMALVLLLLFLEIVAYFFNPYRHYPKASESYRNPTIGRGWTEYLDCEKAADKKLIVLISNSQGIGFELNSDSIYFAYLKNKLEKNYPVVLENWSKAGMSMPEIEVELLIDKAINRKADEIIISLHPFFRQGINLNLQNIDSDIGLLVSESDMWDKFDSPISQNIGKEEIISAILHRHSNLLRSASVAIDYFSLLVPPRYHKFFFGRKIVKFHVLNLETPLVKKLLLKKMKENIERVKRFEIQKVSDEEVRQAFKLVNQFVAHLKKRVEKYPVKIIFILPPFSKGLYNDEATRKAKKVYAQVGKLLMDNGFPNYNFLNIIPDSCFYTRAHFDTTGHRLFFKKLYPILEQELQE